MLAIFESLKRTPKEHGQVPTPFQEVVNKAGVDAASPERKTANVPSPMDAPQEQEMLIEKGLDQTAVPGKQDIKGPDSKEGTPSDQAPSRLNTVRFYNKDIGAVALEEYGTLDLNILKALKQENPGITDWNALDPSVALTLPEVPVKEGSTVDFYTLQLTSTMSETKALEVAQDLSKQGIQNVFVVRHAPSPETDKIWIRVCQGVFETYKECLEWVGRSHGWGWGFDDAFVTRLQGKYLKDVLGPYQGPAPEASSPSHDNSERNQPVDAQGSPPM